MSEIVYDSNNLIVVIRDGNYYVRYDAGAHFVVWREDLISKEEFEGIKLNDESANLIMFKIQRRLEEAGINPYQSNWKP